MNKFLAIAALGSVNACHMKPLFGLLEQGPNCPETDAKKLNHHEAWMKLFQVMNNGFTKGFYQENQDIISDQCFGDQFEPVFTAWHDIHHQFKKDYFWGLSVDEVKGAVDLTVDAFFENIEACQWRRVVDDGKTWCMEHPGACIFGEGMEDRLFDNMFDIFGKLFDLYKMAEINDTCYSDMEKMGEVYRFSEDLGELSASLAGFDYKWDASAERTHIKRKQFHTWVRDTIKEYKDKDILELIAPDLKDLLDGIADSIDEFVQFISDMIDEFVNSVDALFAPPVHHGQHHRQQFRQPFDIFQMPMGHFDLGDFRLF